jgi:hypothetical protein
LEAVVLEELAVDATVARVVNVLKRELVVAAGQEEKGRSRKYLKHEAIEEGTGCVSSCRGDGESSCIDSTKDCKRCKYQAADRGEHDEYFLSQSEMPRDSEGKGRVVDAVVGRLFMDSKSLLRPEHDDHIAGEGCLGVEEYPSSGI